MADRIDIENGKYTVVIDGGHIQILRGGEPWVGQERGGFIASKAWMAAAYELEELRKNQLPERATLARLIAGAHIGGLFGPQGDDYKRADAIIEAVHRG